MKRTSKSFRFVVALLLVFALSFPVSFNAYAVTDGTADQTSNSSNALQTASDSANTETVNASSIYDIGESTVLAIESVQVVNGGQVQSQYRDIVEGTGDNAGMYFIDLDTDYKPIASMTDARIFKVSTTFAYSTVGIESFSEFSKENLVWTYGAQLLSQWEKLDPKSNTFSGDQAISVVPDSLTISNNSEGKKITITAKVLFDAFYPVSESNVNVPYDGYTPTTKGGFPTLQADSNTILGTHALTLSYQPTIKAIEATDPVKLASNDIELNLYDSFHTWQEIEAFAKQLQSDSDDSTSINGRYVSVQPIGESAADRKIWNVVIAKDDASVNDYLNVTKPMMDSQEGINTLLKELNNPELTEYNKLPIYFNNVHPDETPASDAIIELINKFIYEESLTYKTDSDAEHHGYTKENGYDGYTGEGPDKQIETVTYDVDDILDRFILVFNITENPDGKDNLVRTNEYGFDLNRDAAYQTQPEATALTSDMVKWDPVSMLEYHGYVEGLLIEPCTGPHDPNYEYDLYQEKMLAQGNTLGKAMIGNTGYNQYLVPAMDYQDGWDDGAPVYGPMFAMLYGVMGYTLEIPHATEDSKDACVSAGLALANDCLTNYDKYFKNKLDYKLRGINNEDNKAVDTYLTDPYTGQQVGRPRVEGQSFFPEYYVIPVDDTNQRNPLEAYKALEFLQRNGAVISKLMFDTTYNDIKLPLGTYVIDMHQANRGFVNSMLSDGYDASNFADIYAEIVISYPDMRNFDCLTVREGSVFEGKYISVDKITMPETEISAETGLVVIKNNNIDAIRLVNRLLNKDVPVYMMTSDLAPAQKGDYVVDRKGLEAIDYSDLLVYDVEVDAPIVNMEQIKEPSIKILGSTAHSKYIMDLLEFDGDYQYISGAYAISPDTTDVIVGFNSNTDVDSYVNGGIGYIGIGTSALSFVKTSGLLPGFDYSRPGASYNEGLIEASYSDDSLVTANYDHTDAAYVMNGTFITQIPTDGEDLITISSDSDFFKAGWFPSHDVLKGESLAVTGYTGANHNVPITLFANNIFSKAHAQHTLNMFANALFLTASDIELTPYVAATPSSQSTKEKSVTVELSYAADRAGDSSMTLTAKKYKVTTSSQESVYTDGAGWLDYTGKITLSEDNNYYIHVYALNSVGESYQAVFGPYNIGTNNSHHHNSGSSSNNQDSKQNTTKTSAAFTDISGHWAASSIKYVTEKKLFSGISNNRFGPENTMTRGMLVTVLGRASNIDTAAFSKNTTFSDVPQTGYYAPYIAWAYENKIVSGTGDGMFSPDKPVTRGEMAVIITNYMKYIGKGTASSANLSYADITDIESWGLEGVQFVTANGLMTGTSGNNFNFDGMSTRAQVATVMERLIRLIEQ